MESYELDGQTYYFKNGKWLTSNYMTVPTSLLGRLNKMVLDNKTEKTVQELISLLDGAKLGYNIPLALNVSNDALKKATPKELKFLLPRVTSVYRKNNQAEKAIRVAQEYLNQYGTSVQSSVLFTSIAAAYCDLGEIEAARKTANKAMALDNGNCSAELISVFARIKRLE